MAHEGVCLCGGSKVIVNANPEFNASTYFEPRAGGINHADEQPFLPQITCHCSDCRQCNGTAFSCQVLVPATSAKVEGTVKTFDIKVPNGNTVRRWFCTGCGSALMHRSEAHGDNICVQTGNVEAFTKLPIGMEVFVEDRWPHVPPVPGAEQIQGMPVL
ncbi:hypothetical protein AMATHDRAFT_148931 [Amanita thiersii Skay4041]|uniref:CENP-V/GFA domain-containing protein n=1 Tax=Amanita thiersii Skay4041 TaxID=703135 RepID=A0A2A9NHT1_9AGAR|nr:hypothetical protein AMATHDRAFT_148931 [Amanita thiersii Skay4041]